MTALKSSGCSKKTCICREMAGPSLSSLGDISELPEGPRSGWSFQMRGPKARVWPRQGGKQMTKGQVAEPSVHPLVLAKRKLPR